ncbi:MAG: hypothetical protein GTO02_07665, partial [Candidatus Dadabacteria bacterium]|nr:hypothetical protein [Candidatus Dadabacteria bacterium]NIQ14272.1 hypothetical protein [Candidatus Dadabacteria bacterium]
MRLMFLCFFTVLLTYTAFVYSEQKIFENINIYKISNSTTVEIELEQLIDNLNTSSVIYIGEIHDKPVHHLIQLEIIKKIHEQNKYV